MPFWSNLKTCGVHLVYLFIFFWMLIKEFLGYQVEWSRRPFTQTGPISRKVWCGVHKNSKDLEANLNFDKPPSTGSSKTMTSEEKLDDHHDLDYFVIYEVHPVETKKAIFDWEPSSQPLPPLPVSLEAQQQTQDRTKDSLGDHFNIPAVIQSIGKEVGHKGPIAEAINDSPHEHRQLEDATTNRLNFVKGLRYEENNNFKFPVILSALRVKSIKLNNLLQTATITSIPTTRPSSKQKAYSISTATSVIPKLQQMTVVLDPSSPSLSLPPAQTSTSSISSYSSCTITETSLADFATPADENIHIPFSFDHNFPSWHRDPDCAKSMFGSFARSVIDSNSDGKSEAGATNDGQGHFNSIEKPKAEGERTSSTTTSLLQEAAIPEKYSTPKNQRLERMIIAMGLNPFPSASTLHSDFGIFEDKGQGKVQSSKEHDITHTGLAALMNTAMSRESVISDLLSWMESSSSISSR